MLSVEEARSRILAGLRPTSAESVALDAAHGRVIARPILARRSNPPADVSAMDGYAVRAADTALGTRLRVIGVAPAGRPFEATVEAGTCVRIFTGSVMPPGSDAVLIQEHAGRDGDVLAVLESVSPGRYIRGAGQDFAHGDTVLAAGRRLGARDIGLAAAADHAWITCHRRPVVALLATGDELVLPGEPVPPGGIADANTPMLAAAIRAAGGVPLLLPAAPDRIDAIAESLDGLRCDLLVSIGGASVGEYDLVQAGLAERGLAVDFWKIAMRPGKPLMHGRLQRDGAGIPVLGLPGNPVSAMVCALLFLLPAIARLSGEGGDPLEVEPAVLAGAGPANDARADHLRASLGREGGVTRVTPFERQDSAMLRRLAEADALILRPPHAPALAAGATVEIIRLDRFGW